MHRMLPQAERCRRGPKHAPIRRSAVAAHGLRQYGRCASSSSSSTSRHEPLGHLDPLLRESGFRIRYVNFGRETACRARRASLRRARRAGRADERRPGRPLSRTCKTEVAAIRDAVTADKPVLGICLGGQLLAQAMGATCIRTRCPRSAGTGCTRGAHAHDDLLFRHFERSPRYVFQWHAYAFQPPPGAVPLAWTRSCGTRPTASATARGACSSTSRPTRR